MNRRERRIQSKHDRRNAAIQSAGHPVLPSIFGPDIRLHIGGKVRVPGWMVLNALPGPHVDVLGNCKDMSQFADGSCAVVYASHVLEHLGYDKELPDTIREIFRILQPGGQLLLSVPDLDTLCGLILDKTLTPEERYYSMCMLFGGRSSEYDIHYAGLNEEFLRAYLSSCGFTDLLRVEGFGLFDDASSKVFKGRLISVNMRAVKPIRP